MEKSPFADYEKRNKDEREKANFVWKEQTHYRPIEQNYVSIY